MSQSNWIDITRNLHLIKEYVTVPADMINIIVGYVIQTQILQSIFGIWIEIQS